MKNIEFQNLGLLLAAGELNIQTGPFGTQLKASDYSDTGVPVINVRNIGYRTEKISELEYLNEKQAHRLQQHCLEFNDIVFGRKGAVDRHIIIKKKQAGWIQGSDCIRIRINSKSVLPDFLSYYFLTSGHMSWMEAQGSFGATMSTLNQGIIERISFPQFKISIQRKISAVLSAYDDLIENNTNRITLLEKMAEEIYREWFVRLRFPGHENTKSVKGVPERWCNKKLGEVCSLISRGISPEYSAKSERVVINQKCIRDSGLDLSHSKRHDSEVPQKKVLQYGDVLINSTGVGTLGRVAAVEYEINGITCDSHVTICRADRNEIGIHFLAFTLKKYQSYFESIATGSTGQIELSKSQIANTTVMVPDKLVSEKFSNLISPVWNLKHRLNSSNRLLSIAKGALLTRLMAGKIDLEPIDIQSPPSMREEPLPEPKAMAYA